MASDGISARVVIVVSPSGRLRPPSAIPVATDARPASTPAVRTADARTAGDYLSGLRLQGARADLACLYVYDCKRCQHRMKAINGKCGGCRWVFCSYGSTPCPPARCRPGTAAPDSISPDIAAVAAPDYSLKIWRLLRRAPAPLASMRLHTVEAFFRDALGPPLDLACFSGTPWRV